MIVVIVVMLPFADTNRGTSVPRHIQCCWFLCVCHFYLLFFLLGNSSTGLNGGNTLIMDVRNTSLDSFSEDNIVVGLSTVPNQFCTKRDALELKKLLILSAGTRGACVVLVCSNKLSDCNNCEHNIDLWV